MQFNRYRPLYDLFNYNDYYDYNDYDGYLDDYNNDYYNDDDSNYDYYQQDDYPQASEPIRLQAHQIISAPKHIKARRNIAADEDAVWGNERNNPCLRYYTGVVNGLKVRNKFTVPGWRTRLHFRGDWSTQKNNGNDDEEDDRQREEQRVKCRREPNWRRLRPIPAQAVLDYGYNY